ncbi:MAG: hypothetical protein P8M30_01170 [Planctomycetaceae bacterium]|nr:hypothetical protein [Planctomycetaceae bacterium]MDG2387905.1 hypothetical protein [Planctomycetaceae bacterium]
MNSRSVLTTSVVSGLFGLYMVYALVMNALIGVQTLEQAVPKSLPAPKRPSEPLELAKKYLVPRELEYSWELDADYMVNRESSHLYFNDWIHRSYHPDDPENAIEFTPFAMVLKSKTDRPLTMQSESARIRFSNQFSMQNPDTGRPVEGALEGKVRITGPNGLEITGRKFVYSEENKYIYSDQMVEFQFGKHRGRADGIRLDVMIDRALISKEDFAVAGLDKITFRRKVFLEVYPEQTENIDKLVVNCDGGLVFDTKLNVATFRDRVSVVAPSGFSSTGTDQPDSLNCDILKLLFSSETAKTADVSENDDEEFRGIQDDLVLTEIDASAVSRRVTFVSKQNGIEAEMDKFHYNQITRVATLQDPSDQVVVSQRQTKIYSPSIVLQHDEEGELTSVVCDGIGELFYYDELNRELQLRTSWERQLRVFPEQGSGLYLIELDQRAIVTQPADQLGLAADHIKLWIKQTESATPKPRSASPAASWSGDGMEPQNMLALGNVRMAHPSFKGSTKRLEVWFKQVAPVTPGISQTPRAKNNVIKKRVQPVHYQNESRSPAAQIAAPEEVLEPYHAWADLIQVLFYLSEDQESSYVGGVVTTGDVKLTQPKLDGSQPLEIIGDRVEMRNRDAGNVKQVVQVFGSPARITDAKMSLAGNLLNLDRSSNRTWVTGPGVMMQEVYSDLNGNRLPSPELLKVWWNEKMEFDGRDARFYDGVRTQLGKSTIQCQEMLVRLDSRIDFQEQGSQPGQGPDQKPEIERLECLYGVEVDSEEYEDGKLTEIRQGEFGKLVYERGVNQTRIIGPGVIYLWRLSDGTPIGFSGSERSPPVADASKPKPNAGWEYLEIVFNGDIDGYLDQRITHFENGVKIVYGPVAQPGMKIDPHDLPDEGGWIRSEELDVARTEADALGNSWLELRASGNVKLEGKDKEQFRARADMVTFSQKDQKYRFRALGDRYTTIWRQKRPGDELTRVEAKVMQFRPSTHDLNLEQTRSLEGIE